MGGCVSRQLIYLEGSRDIYTLGRMTDWVHAVICHWLGQEHQGRSSFAYLGQGKESYKVIQKVQLGMFQLSDKQEPIPRQRCEKLCIWEQVCTQGSVTTGVCLAKVWEEPNSCCSQDEKNPGFRQFQPLLSFSPALQPLEHVGMGSVSWSEPYIHSEVGQLFP